MITIDTERPRIYRYDTVDSTNSVLRDLAEQGAASGSVVVAEEQTAGRGRGQKKWVSPRGGVWCSYLWRQQFPPEQSAQMSLAIGLATCAVISQVCGVGSRLAWPNDIMVNSYKVAGIISENYPARGLLIAGIGINLNIPQERMPREVEKPATSIQIETGREFDESAIVEFLQGQLGDYLGAAPQVIAAEYARHAYWPEGQKVRVESHSPDEKFNVIEGVVIGVQLETGELIVRSEANQDYALTAGTVNITAV